MLGGRHKQVHHSQQAGRSLLHLGKGKVRLYRHEEGVFLLRHEGRRDLCPCLEDSFVSVQPVHTSQLPISC